MIWHADRGPLGPPDPAALSEASPSELRAVGFSLEGRVCAGGSRRVSQKGSLNFDALKQKTTQEAYANLIDQRGFGDWSAQYIIARGLVRPNCLPSGDTGLRRVVGKLLARRPASQPTATRAGTFALRTIPWAGRLLFVGSCTPSARPIIHEPIVGAGDDWLRTFPHFQLDHRAGRDRPPLQKECFRVELCE